MKKNYIEPSFEVVVMVMQGQVLSQSVFTESYFEGDELDDIFE